MADTALAAAGTSLLADVGSAVGYALPVGIGILGVVIAWNVFKRFTR